MRTVLLAGVVLGIVVVLGWLAALTLSSGRALRTRNAFLLRRGALEDFSWTPSHVPPDFSVERNRAPAAIETAVTSAGIQSIADDWQRALALVGMLIQHWQREGAIRSDLATIYREIVAGGGDCSDYVRVYLAAASMSNIFCRQWAFSINGFGDRGHTFVEVFDRKRNAWKFLDVHNNVYAVRAGTDQPFSALELRQALTDAPSTVEFRAAGPGRLGFSHFDRLLEYYKRGAAEWSLWWGNDVVSRDRVPFDVAIARWSGRFQHWIRAAFTPWPKLVAYETDGNRPQISRMERLRRQVVGLLLFLLVLLVALIVLLAARVY